MRVLVICIDCTDTHCGACEHRQGWWERHDTTYSNCELFQATLETKEYVNGNPHYPRCQACLAADHGKKHEEVET